MLSLYCQQKKRHSVAYILTDSVRRVASRCLWLRSLMWNNQLVSLAERGTFSGIHPYRFRELRFLCVASTSRGDGIECKSEGIDVQE